MTKKVFKIPTKVVYYYRKTTGKGENTMSVTKDMTIEQILQTDIGIAEILTGAGMHCLGCVMAHGENLEQACAVHGIDADVHINAINSYLESK